MKRKKRKKKKRKEKKRKRKKKKKRKEKKKKTYVLPTLGNQKHRACMWAAAALVCAGKSIATEVRIKRGHGNPRVGNQIGAGTIGALFRVGVAHPNTKPK